MDLSYKTMVMKLQQLLVLKEGDYGFTEFSD